MEYRTCAELEMIGKTGAASFDQLIGEQAVRKCRVLSSYWVCTFSGKDGIAEHLAEDGFWESWITCWISNNVKPGSVCIDAGSTYGYYTFFLAQHGCRVYSIEANPALIPLLEYANYLNGSYDRVTIINKAVANESGKSLRLGFSDSIGGTSVNLSAENGSVHVESILLDDLLVLEKRFDFIKLDVSGSEQRALEGMKKIFSVNPACTCIMEFAPSYYPEKGLGFFNNLLQQFFIACIDVNGQEVMIRDYSFFENRTEPWVMLVLRTRYSAAQSPELIVALRDLD